MPWTDRDAERHTHKASTARLKHLWQRVANRVLSTSGDEASAIKIANAQVNKQRRRGNV